MKSRSMLTVLLMMCISISLSFAASTNTKIIDSAWGLIFSIDNLFQGIGEYNGGIGIKLPIEDKGKEIMDLRCTVNLDLIDGINNINVTAGAAAEFPLLKNQAVSPYWGLTADVGFQRLHFNLTDVDYSETADYSLVAGGIIGVEFFLMEYLSIFVEYQAAAYLSLNSYYLSNAPADAENPVYTVNFNFLTEMGNDAKFGIVIYSKPIVTLKK